MIFPYQTYYIGELKNMFPDGYGKRTYPDGNVYTGYFKRKKRAGFGEVLNPDGVRFSRKWKKDRMNGPGKVTFPDGTSADCVFRNGQITRNLRLKHLLAKIKKKINSSEGK